MNLVYISIAVILSTVYWLYFLLKYDKVEREPIDTVVGIGFTGAILSVGGVFIYGAIFYTVFPFAEIVNDHASWFFCAFDGMHVGLYEEFMKMGAALLLVMTLKQFNEPVDAIIYSMTIGMGFAAIENVIYAMSNGFGILFVRSMISMPVHMGCAAVWGLGIATFRYNSSKSLIKTLLPFYLVSAFLHGLFDFIHFMDLSVTPTLGFAIIFTIGIMAWSKRQLKYLVSQSPFLEKGKCPECDTFNDEDARFCLKCGASLTRDFIQVEIDKESGVPIDVQKARANTSSIFTPRISPSGQQNQNSPEPEETIQD